MIFLIIIVFVSIIFGLALKDYLSFFQEKHINYKPIIVSIGVLGTFLGIVLGLWNFDSHDIEASVPQLLDGLKLAFITSVIAMAVSIFLSVIQAKPDEKPKEDDSSQTLKKILDEVTQQNNDHEIKQTLKKILDKLTQLHTQLQNDIHQDDIHQDDSRFTKLSANGEALSEDAAKWFAILDNDTGLVWEIQENKQIYTIDDSSTYIEEVNKKQLASYNDWRLPSIEELETLIQGNSNSVDRVYFPNIQLAWYLSSTQNPEKKDHFYCLNFSNCRKGSSHNANGLMILTRK